jgi:ABC-type multidrug transport system ATPase subunit
VILPQRTELRGCPRPPEENVSALRIERLATKLIGPISFDVAAGECLALMGPSGAGKSLLLRAIVDLDPSSGNVMVGVHARNDMTASEWRKRVALVPAESGWWADRVRDHFPAKVDATGLMEKLGLAGALEWDVGRLSSGERQRLGLARALCRRPEALLLDEPTASLDEHATGLVEDLMRECCGKGMALLLVTHDRRQAERMAKQLLRMSDGRIDQPSESLP